LFCDAEAGRRRVRGIFAKFRRRWRLFWEMEQRWIKWTDRHQHLPLSMARLGCSSFYEGKWAGSEKAFDQQIHGLQLPFPLAGLHPRFKNLLLK
ncbi:unnamed protein product, partial [Pylaiella littoralis]